MRPTTRAFFLTAALLAAIGCGKNPPDVKPAQGVVTLNGQPAPNLMLQFSPITWPEGTPVLAATAVSDAAGKFVLLAHDGRPGVTAGKHKVTVLDNNLNVEEENGPNAKKLVNRVPRSYSATTTTPIEIEIVAGQSEYEVNVKR